MYTPKFKCQNTICSAETLHLGRSVGYECSTGKQEKSPEEVGPREGQVFMRCGACGSLEPYHLQNPEGQTLVIYKISSLARWWG